MRQFIAGLWDLKKKKRKYIETLRIISSFWRKLLFARDICTYLFINVYRVSDNTCEISSHQFDLLVTESDRQGKIVYAWICQLQNILRMNRSVTKNRSRYRLATENWYVDWSAARNLPAFTRIGNWELIQRTIGYEKSTHRPIGCGKLIHGTFGFGKSTNMLISYRKSMHKRIGYRKIVLFRGLHIQRSEELTIFGIFFKGGKVKKN